MILVQTRPKPTLNKPTLLAHQLGVLLPQQSGRAAAWKLTRPSCLPSARPSDTAAMLTAPPGRGLCPHGSRFAKQKWVRARSLAGVSRRAGGTGWRTLHSLQTSPPQTRHSPNLPRTSEHQVVAQLGRLPSAVAAACRAAGQLPRAQPALSSAGPFPEVSEASNCLHEGQSMQAAASRNCFVATATGERGKRSQ